MPDSFHSDVAHNELLMGKELTSRIAVSTLRLLLVGENEEDFHSLRNLLGQAEHQIVLEHAVSHEEAISLLSDKKYDLVLCDYKSGNGMALRLLHEMHKNESSVPVVFLSEHVDEQTVAAAIAAGAFACVPGAHLSEANVVRTICYAIDMYCKERQQQKAEEMLRKLWRAVEQSADLVVITDRSGVIEYVNPAFSTLTDYTAEEVIGKTLRLLKSPNQPAELYKKMWNTILGGKIFRGIVVNRKKNGENITVEKTITPLRDSDGQITHFISTDRDITERRRLEVELQQVQKMDAVGRLAGGVAHDFNNLLMVISAYAELMLETLEPDHRLRHNVEEIIKASGRAAELTRQLLAFGRKQRQALQILDLNMVVREMSRMLERLIGEDVALAFLPAPDLGRVKADTAQVEQILMNLVANARDAMPEGGTVTIETTNVRLDEAYVEQHSMVPAGDYVLLAVTDSGEGIARQHLAHIFEPFYTTKEKGKGTGLGLATVYGIVKQSGGFVWVYSEPKMGTTFKIYLPRVQKEADKPPVPEAGTKALQGRETVLLVEDETAVRMSVNEFLRLSGYTVLEAGSGEEALRVARDYPAAIDLMVTDVVMPQMSGASLAEQLAKERPAMKVLFVSGYAETTVARHGAINVTTRFLQKPFTLRTLAKKIWEVLHEEDVSAAAAVLP